MRKALGFFVLLVSIWGFFGQPGVLARVDGLRGTAVGILRSPESVLSFFEPLGEQASGVTVPRTEKAVSKDKEKQPEKVSMQPKSGEVKESPSKAEQKEPGADAKEPGDNIRVGTEKLKEWERAAFDAVNAERKRLGLDPFEWDEEAAKVCRLRAKEMFECRVFAHYSPISAKSITPYFESSLFYDFCETIQRPGYECIASQSGDVKYSKDGVVRAAMIWYKSPDHRKIMTDPLIKKGAIGLAVVDKAVNVRYLKTPTWVDKIKPTVTILCFIGYP